MTTVHCSAFESWRLVKCFADATGKDQFDSQHVSVVLYTVLITLPFVASGLQGRNNGVFQPGWPQFEGS